MILTNKQEQGLKIAINNYKNGKPYTVIAGYAGSGKTTLVSYLVQALIEEGINPKKVVYTSFTGKACQTLINKGNTNAQTLHKLLYKTKPTSDGKFIFIPKFTEDIDAELIICDECSMAPASLVKLLLSHHIHVIFVGDNGQLPPINPADDNHLLDHPDVFLDEIVRQAKDSGIIQLTQLIREGASLNGFESNDVRIIKRKDLSTGMLCWGDIVLTATNATRIGMNQAIRETLGKEGDICEGDKVIALRNYWEITSQTDNALTNGCIGEITNIWEKNIALPHWFNNQDTFETISANFTTETNDYFGRLSLDKQCILTGTSPLTPKQKFQWMKNEKRLGQQPLEFTYGYAITCHKAQGSQWDNVVAIEEGFPRDKEEHKRWLYTACTRAAKKLVLIR